MERGLIFDCDGVLADTELHGHLVAFNRMWKKLGVPWQWSDEQYAEKLKIGGGKERMASLFLEQGVSAGIPRSEKRRRAQSFDHELAQGEDGNLPADYLIGRDSAAFRDQENRGIRSRRRLEVGGGIDLRSTVRGGRANPCRRRVHRKTICGICR